VVRGAPVLRRITDVLRRAPGTITIRMARCGNPAQGWHTCGLAWQARV